MDENKTTDSAATQNTAADTAKTEQTSSIQTPVIPAGSSSTELDEGEELKTKTSTIVRTICLALALINQLLLAAGYKALPITDDQVNVTVSTLLTVGVSIWAWWKNNSFTKPAIKADSVMKVLKNG